MTLDKLKTNLSKRGTIQICNEGLVFTLLMTGKNLSDWQTVSAIQMDLLEYAGYKYPVIETMKNDKEFLCIVLRPA